MLILFFSILLFTFIGIITSAVKSGDELSDAFIPAVIGAILVGMTLGIPMTIITNRDIKNKPWLLETRSERVCRIWSLEDNAEIRGSFTLGTGRVNEKPVYTWYYKTQKGFKLGQIDADKCYIEETDTTQPDLIKVTTATKKGWYQGLVKQEHWVLRVPKGTVVKRFNLDSKL